MHSICDSGDDMDARHLSFTDALLLALLFWGVWLTPDQYHIATIVAGESGICPRPAQAAIAHMYEDDRNRIFFASEQPSTDVLGLVLNLENELDETPTARFIVSREDHESGVLDVGREVGRWPCAGGALELRAYEAVR